jgi:hypothetical protein
MRTAQRCRADCDALALEQHVEECPACFEKRQAALPAHNSLANPLAGRDMPVCADTAHPLVGELIRKLDNLKRPKPGARMLAFTCSACQKTLGVKEELAGKKVKCPGCGAVVIALVPVAASGPPAKLLAPLALQETLAPTAGADEPRTTPPTSMETLAPAGTPSVPPNGLTFLGPPTNPDTLGWLGHYEILTA